MSIRMYFKEIIIDPSILTPLKSRDNVSLNCDNCHRMFNRKKNVIQIAMSKKTTTAFCSRSCRGIGNIIRIQCRCTACGKEFFKRHSQLKEHRNDFCNKSCSAHYNNKNKTHGTRRSKLEKWLETTINKHIPDLKILYNSKIAIGSELDIYIPSLSLAFEVNGIFHYKPIHGPDRLEKIQRMDAEKRQMCEELGIMLITINTSSQRVFTEVSSMIYLETILDTIKAKTGAGLVL